MPKTKEARSKNHGSTRVAPEIANGVNGYIKAGLDPVFETISHRLL